MNDIQRCLGCFDDASGRNPCPKCGWDKTKGGIGLHLEPGQILHGRYLLGRVLGQGGFGITYLGWDNNLQSKVAIKEYLYTQLASRTAATTQVVAHGNCQQKFAKGVELFLAEARTLAKFKLHPNIVTVTDYFEAHGTGYFVMDYAPGMSLKDFLQEHGRLSWWDAAPLFLQIAEGLRATHDSTVMHLDISPDNLYLEMTPKNKRVIRVMLMDFGNSKHYGIEQEQQLSTVLKSGYSPPEQYSAQGKRGPWTDVYALGATLYNALTGKEPQPSMDRMDRDDISPAQKSVPGIPATLAELLDSMLALKPENRAGLDKVRAILRQLIDSETGWQRVLHRLERQAGVIVSLCLSAALLSGAYVLTALPYTDGELDAIIGHACRLPTPGPAVPGWHAEIEIGASGIKPVAVQFEGLAQKNADDKFKTADVTPYEPKSLPKVVEGVCGSIGQLQQKYGDLPIYLVGSSGIVNAPHLPDIKRWLNKATQKDLDLITAEQEMRYLSRGAWKTIPAELRCKSTLVDIGSGNIKGGYISDCDAEQSGGEAKFEAFNIDDFGTKAFTKKVSTAASGNDGAAQQAWRRLKKWFGAVEPPRNIGHAEYMQAVNAAGGELKTAYAEQIGINGGMVSGKSNVYLVGGAVWGLNTLMCLDCPQYDGRSNKTAQRSYTAIKLSDINEFYRYVTATDASDICDPDRIPNPYLNQNIDSHSAMPLPPERLQKQKKTIRKVCDKFASTQSSNNLISMAEILRVTADSLEIDEHRQLFFLQDQLFTWPREYLIEKIQNGGKAVN